MKKIIFLLLFCIAPSICGDKKQSTVDVRNLYKIVPLWWGTATIDCKKINLEASLHEIIKDCANKSYTNSPQNVQDYYAKVEKNTVIQKDLREEILKTIYLSATLKEHLQKATHVSLEQLLLVLMNKITDQHEAIINQLGYTAYTKVPIEFTAEECEKIFPVNQEAK